MKKLNILKTISFFMIMILTLLMPLTTTVNAATVLSDNVVYALYGDTKYSIVSYFNPSHKVVDGEDFNLRVNRNVCRAYVRAQSSGLTVASIKICSSYDSGRSYSKMAKSKKDNFIISTPKEEVKNCFSCVQKLNYGWEYFK